MKDCDDTDGNGTAESLTNRQKPSATAMPTTTTARGYTFAVRQAAVAIIDAAGAADGDKSHDRALADGWTKEHVSALGPKPSPRASRRWHKQAAEGDLREVRNYGAVKAEDGSPRLRLDAVAADAAFGRGLSVGQDIELTARVSVTFLGATGTGRQVFCTAPTGGVRPLLVSVAPAPCSAEATPG